MCSVCVKGFSQDEHTNLCEKCGDNFGISNISFTSPTFILLWVLLALYLLSKVCKGPLAKYFDKNGDGIVSSAWPCLRRMIKNIYSSQKLRILVGLYQIISPMAFNLGVEFPSMFQETVSSFKVFNLDLIPSLNLACMYEFNFISSLYAQTLWPLIVSFILLVVVPLFTCCRRRGNSFIKVSSEYLTPVLTISFLVFVSTSTKILSYFKCDDIADTGESWLEKDYSISCEGDTYNGVRFYATTMIFVYPIGIPTLYAVMLFPKRHILSKAPSDRTQAEIDAVAHLSFLAASYRPEFFFFEVGSWLLVRGQFTIIATPLPVPSTLPSLTRWSSAFASSCSPPRSSSSLRARPPKASSL